MSGFDIGKAVFFQHTADDALNLTADMAAFLLRHGIEIDRVTEFNDNSGSLDKRNMVLKNIFRIGNGYRDDQTAGFLGNLEAAFLKLQHVIPRGTCTFRENADGTAAFDGGNTVEDRL